MEVRIIHRTGSEASKLVDELVRENISARTELWNPAKELPSDLFDSHLIIVCIDRDRAILGILKELTSEGRWSLPIILLDTHYDQTTALFAKNNRLPYYIPPYNPTFIGRMIKELVYKHAELTNSGEKIEAFDILLDPTNRCAQRRDRVIPLRNKEFALLEFFIMNKGRLLSRTSILEHVWDRNHCYGSNTLDVHINRLRRKIDGPFDDKLIHTVHCVGYRFAKAEVLSHLPAAHEA
ncbi:hypothetical protein CO046_05275 [Candidatus Peregrinibacteria bacterium CG_4_9_14_0_2_um_filter_53_11]|nr:MAG: hypothetical protein CO046_05275 [Candidatus Peregrinibacteria bacterium CG_4_9_14_0_2_um_filter_53_11]